MLPGGAQLSSVESGPPSPVLSQRRPHRPAGGRGAGATPTPAGSSIATSSRRNLLLDTAGIVWVTDFGLAKTEDDGLTNPGDLLGTLRYMAPERFRGEGDGRADVYALGLTLYELLTLRPAFDSPDRLRLIELVKTQEPARPRSLDPRIPRDLETIVLKAIAKDPQRRYQTADELAEDLRRFLADEPIQARQVGFWDGPPCGPGAGPPRRPWPWSARWRPSR